MKKIVDFKELYPLIWDALLDYKKMIDKTLEKEKAEKLWAYVEDEIAAIQDDSEYCQIYR